MAQYLMTKYLFDKKITRIKIDSAGLRAKHGAKISDNSFKLLSDFDIKTKHHGAKQLTKELYDKSDLILVMEQSQVDEINALKSSKWSDSFNTDIDNKLSEKVFLLGRWDNNCEIRDPYAMGYENYKLAFEQIECSTRKWVKKLQFNYRKWNI